jgi:hypothetical protein
MSPDEYFAWLARRIDSAARKAAEAIAVQGEQMLRDRIPNNRPKTRRAVMHYIKKRGNGYRVTYGLRFAVRYRTSDRTSKSFQIFHQSWRRSEKRIAQLFRREFFAELNQ